MDIERCKTSYELRYVIAYEAAIRNEEIANALYEYLANERADAKEALYKYGFTDESIFYYRLTHLEEFPVTKVDTHHQGLSSIEANDASSPSPYKIQPLCPKLDAVITNDTPLIRENDSITKADIDDYPSFSKLSLELQLIRPKLHPPAAKRFYVELNFELPESELTEYIVQLHKEYHKHHIPGAMELLGDISLNREQLTKANTMKYADMLYVYDYVNKFGDLYTTDKELHEKIGRDLAYSAHRDDKNMLSTNTIRNYRNAMTETVENFGFLSLLTGIEN